MRWHRWLALLLIVIAGLLAFIGYRWLNESTPTPVQLINQGRIALYTSDPETRGRFWVSPAQEDSGRISTESSTIDVFFDAEAKERTVWWAVVFGQDAQLPTNGFEQSGRIEEEQSQLGHLSVEAGDPVYYVTNVNWPGDMGDGRGATVIFSRVSRALQDVDFTPISVTFTFPVQKPLVADSGEFLTLSTPQIGKLSFDDPSESLHFFQKRGTDPQLVTMLKRKWFGPKSLEIEFQGSFKRPFVTQQSGTQPVAPFETRWTGRDRLKVEATFARPSVASAHERETFFAGAAISLAASFLVWALELFIGPERVPAVRRLRRRPD